MLNNWTGFTTLCIDRNGMLSASISQLN